ncbi:hypothetical protein RND71_003400 [Anisodus tanguticus]|uniref:PB1 domain-containing protein n=1 Tax=Anisodus tanguticus TaxID=243964 RepID=A0AAE1SWD4_9SOLA|nr:hypothetical protein RND71_003400 [Anisodus tanguticus]
MVLKYQLMPEDLDSLVSVKSDEDLRHMLDEYDRCESAGVPRLRAFIFPAKHIVLDHVASTEPLEQRYIDAVNGIVRVAEAGIFRLHPPPGVSYATSFGISSACSSPRSPESIITEGVNQEHFAQSNRSQIHKVHSSPSICNLNSQQQRQGFHHIHHNQFHSYKFGKPPPPADPVKGPERLISVRSVGRVEGIRYHVDHSPHYYTRQNRGNGYCKHYDDCSHCGERIGSLSPMDKRNGSFSTSPHSLGPLAGSTDC